MSYRKYSSSSRYGRTPERRVSNRSAAAPRTITTNSTYGEFSTHSPERGSSKSIFSFARLSPFNKGSSSSSSSSSSSTPTRSGGSSGYDYGNRARSAHRGAESDLVGSSSSSSLSSSRRAAAYSSSSSSSSSLSSSSSSTTTTKRVNGKLVCDRCDGDHETDRCPHFRKKRDRHPDAQRRKPMDMGGAGGNFVLRHGRVVPQPGDGSCLFHSMAYGLGGTESASNLRRAIGSFIAGNPDLEICETPMKDWVKWDSNASVSVYARRISRAGWGGGIEMAACSRMKKVDVHVYERNRKGVGWRRISCFDCPGARRTIHVLYQGGVHYDALVV